MRVQKYGKNIIRVVVVVITEEKREGILSRIREYSATRDHRLDCTQTAPQWSEYYKKGRI